MYEEKLCTQELYVNCDTGTAPRAAEADFQGLASETL